MKTGILQTWNLVLIFNSLIMKTLFNKSILWSLAVAAFAVCGCNEVDIAEPQPGNNMEIQSATRITVGLQSTDPDTKLIYNEVSIGGRAALKTKWKEGDAIVANPSPNNGTDVYTFNLIDGIGTGTGVFECTVYPNGYSPDRYQTNAWTIYFPGSSIKEDADFLNFSYEGQVQTGNDNMDHLADFHTLRLTLYPTQTVFDNSFIDFSGDNFDQSSCMKFNLSGLPSGVKPTKITLSYFGDVTGSDVFHTYNTLNSYFGTVEPSYFRTNMLSMELAGFDETTSVTAYMMMSNGEVSLKAGATLKVTVDAANGKKYFCEKPVAADATIKGGTLNTITCTSWTEADNIDGFDNPSEGIVVLQEATAGNGTDIIIMGDGFAATDAHFGSGGDYAAIMRQAYEDFFSIEPYKTLKPYFNVYYINAVSKDDHDAVPYEDSYGNQNGATQGTAKTVFSTVFEEGSTSIDGDIGMVLLYAAQAIRSKGGKGGTPVTDEDEIYLRAYKSLSLVMVNVPCYAGTCALSWDEDTVNDFGNSYSVAYTAIGNNLTERRWTTIHEGGGHGFGKLADEYGGQWFSSFNTGLWIELDDIHSYGVSRNINEYYSVDSRWEVTGWPYTTTSSVYWSELLGSSYSYTTSEGLGLYEGADTYDELFCRPTENSVMRNQFGTNGQFFNAASRWAIWYRVMRLTGSTSAGQFKNSLDEFIAFDGTLNIEMNETVTKTSSLNNGDNSFRPTAPPVMIKGRWENGRFITY